MQGEVRRHVVMKRTETQFPAAFTDAVHDFAAGCDDDLEPGERVALAKFLEQRNADARVSGGGESKRQRRKRAGLDLTDVCERLAFFVQRGFREAQQPNAGFGGLRRIASAQQAGAQPVFEIRDGLADR